MKEYQLRGRVETTMHWLPRIDIDKLFCMMQVEARLRQLEGKGEEGVKTKGLPTPAKYTPGDGATTPKAYNTDADAVDKKAKKEKKRKADDETPGESAKKKKSKKEKKEKKSKD